jgi:hypothetical protein
MAFLTSSGARALSSLRILRIRLKFLDPAATELVPDDSPTFNASLLYLESLRRRNVANDEKIHLGHRGVMNLVPYQLDPALQALRQPRSRILIADAVGLGKTLEAGVLDHRADSTRQGQAHPRRHAEGHAHPVPEGVVEPLLDPTGSVGLCRLGSGAQPHPGQPQPLQLLRPQHHLDRHPQEQSGVPQLSGKRVVGCHRHR